jgi:outer membrane biosynthesis protein TonB
VALTIPIIRMLPLLAVVALTVAAGACAKAKPVTVADGPPLTMPAPPSRVFAPAEEPVPVQAPPPEVADTEPPKPAPRPPARRPAPAAPAEAARPEPEPAPVVAAPAEPPRELRTTPSASDANAERQVRDLLSKASRDLNRFDYRKLSSEGRSQYDQAKRFADQAEQAIKERNFVFAATLAEKAATLASQLGG